MKKFLLFFLLGYFAFAGISKAQDGVTTAFAFGGGMTAVDEMRYASDGDLYFVARMGGKNQFAGNNYDAGGYGVYPLQQWIYGKVSTSGQQTLLKVFERNVGDNNLYNSMGNNHVIDKEGNLYSIMTGTFPGNDYGDGFVETGYGAKLIKTSKTGVVQWVKPINTGVNIAYGSSGTPLPNVNGLQVMSDGSIYTIITSNNQITDSGSPYFEKYPTRIIKYNSSGDEVWHHEMFSGSNGLSFVVNAPKQFVANNGSMVVNIISTIDASFISQGTTLTATHPSSFGSYYNCLMGLDNTGARTWFQSTTWGVSLKAVDPNSATVYASYGYTGGNNTPPPIAPYSSLPNLNTFTSTYTWSGMLKLDIATGNITNSTPTIPVPNNSRFLTGAEKLHVRSDGSLIFYAHKTAFSAIGNYFVPDNYNALIFTDANYNVTKVAQANIEKVELIAENSTNFAFADDFKTAITLGSNTLTPFLLDTDFGTRFPLYASAKADSYIAQGTINQIAPPKTTTWTGAASTAWNDAGNWSNGIADISTTAIFDTNTANQPTVSATTIVGRVVINAGITTTLPTSNLTIKELQVNGILKVPVSGFTYFTAYNAGAIYGNGILEFNGTGSAAMVYPGSLSNQLGLKTNVNLNASGTYKTVEFVGSAIKITGNITIANTNANAITGANATNYIDGKLTQNIVAGTSYSFPVGTSSNYLPVIINTNTLSGVNSITVGTKTGSPTLPDLNIAGSTVNRFSNNGYWTITADATPTSGTYSITLNKNNATNGDTDASKYLALKTTPVSAVYCFEGSLGNRSQTGGSGSSPNFQNSAISVSQNDLESFGDFAIAVMSAPLSEPLTVSTSIWTGATNTDWNNAGNWSNGVPNSLVKATIPAGLSNYPLMYNQTKSYLNNLTIDAGVDVNLSNRLVVTNDVINNGIITVNTTANANSTLPLRRSYNAITGQYIDAPFINGSGKVVFLKVGSYPVLQNGGTINCDVEVNIGDANEININGTYGGNLKVISGKPVNTLSGSAAEPDHIVQLNPTATLEITAPINHIVGQIKKAVSSNGTYDFPIGNYITSTYTGGRKYGAITITNHNIVNTSQYQVRFDGGSTSNFFPQKKGNDVYGTSLNSGYWSITPNVVSTSGTIDLVLKTSNYTNGRADISDYALIRLNNSGYWNFVENAVFSENSGTITVTATGLAPFSTTGETRFYIGLKATTTTWTGTTNTNWNTASNWTNGVPTAEVKAVFGAASQYPSNPPSYGTAAAAVEIASGTSLTLPSSFYTPAGIINNGIINISGSGTFYGFGSGSTFSPISGNGKLVFGAGAPASFDPTYFAGQVLDNSVEVNNATGLNVVNRPMILTGNLTLTNGKLNTSGYVLTMSNPNATATGNANAYVVGYLKRSINGSGNYEFPIGIAGAYTPVTLQPNGLGGTSEITASFSNAAIAGQPNITQGSGSITQTLAGGSWNITPNAQPTAGTYNVTLSAPLGSSTATNFAVIKRDYNYSSYPWALAGAPQGASVNSGVVTASANGVSSFSQFALGEVVGTLPVKLVQFLASADGHTARLTWETASEQNNDRFEVERSEDGKSFIKIGEVKGKGNSNTLIRYSFKDDAPANAVNYYRLKQVDNNGKFEYSEIRSLRFNFSGAEFVVYPNPATEVIHFNDVVQSAQLYDLSGKLVLSQLQQAKTMVLPKTLLPGVYLLRLKLKDDKVVTRRILVRK